MVIIQEKGFFFNCQYCTITSAYFCIIFTKDAFLIFLDFPSPLAYTVICISIYKELFMRKHIYILCFLTGIALLLCACGVSENSFTDYSQYLKPASGNTGSPVPAPAPGDDFSSAVAVVATPAPTAQLPVNTPAPTSTPGPFQTTPAPAEKTPVPTPQQNLVQITKSPTSETVQAGGSAVFIAYADNSTGIVWITVSPDAKTAYDINNAVTAFPSLQVSGQGTSVLTLSNIPYEMDGWRIQAYFTGNGGPLYTAGAYLTVLQQGSWGTVPPGGSTAPGGGGSTAPGDSTEAAVVTLAKQAYSDIYYQTSAAGYSVGSITNYTYLNGRAVFNVTLSNARCRIVGEFSVWYDNAAAYGYGPVHAVVYDLSGNTLLSEHLEGDSMNSFYTIAHNYQY